MGSSENFKLRNARYVQGYDKGKPIQILVVEVAAPRHFLETKAATAWRAMDDAALADGLILHINSAWRSYEAQAALYARWELQGGAQPAKPGRSNHHNGIAVDINRAHDNGRTDKWLAENAGEFGFVKPYSWEPWHWEKH